MPLVEVVSEFGRQRVCRVGSARGFLLETTHDDPVELAAQGEFQPSHIRSAVPGGGRAFGEVKPAQTDGRAGWNLFLQPAT